MTPAIGFCVVGLVVHQPVYLGLVLRVAPTNIQRVQLNVCKCIRKYQMLPVCLYLNKHYEDAPKQVRHENHDKDGSASFESNGVHTVPFDKQWQGFEESERTRKSLPRGIIVHHTHWHSQVKTRSGMKEIPC